MSTSHRVRHGLIAGVVALAATGLVACGTETLDEGDAEAFVEEELGGPSRAESVDCPSDIEVEADATFECTAVTPDGSATATVVVRQTDEEGNVTVDDIQVDPEGGDEASAENWVGTFDSTFGEISFTHEGGGGIVGLYKQCDGQLVGTAEGSTLIGEWQESPEACPDAERPEATYSGNYEFTLAEDGNSFTGTWTYSDGSKSPDSDVWEGTRVSDAP